MLIAQAFSNIYKFSLYHILPDYSKLFQILNLYQFILPLLEHNQ